jgi:hypothetical protein
MTKKQLELIHHAATTETTADQFRSNLEFWIREKTYPEQEKAEPALRYCFLKGAYNPKSGTLLLSHLPDEDDDFREARAWSRPPCN